MSRKHYQRYVTKLKQHGKRPADCLFAACGHTKTVTVSALHIGNVKRIGLCPRCQEREDMREQEYKFESYGLDPLTGEKI